MVSGMQGANTNTAHRAFNGGAVGPRDRTVSPGLINIRTCTHSPRLFAALKPVRTSPRPTIGEGIPEKVLSPEAISGGDGSVRILGRAAIFISILSTAANS